MKNFSAAVLVFSLISSMTLYGQKNKSLQFNSPNGGITVNIEAGNKLEWSIKHKGQVILAPSAIGLQLENAKFLATIRKLRRLKWKK